LQLYSVGARNFLFLNVPPISRAPTTTQKGNNASVLEELDTKDFNHHVAAMARRFAHTHRDTTVFHFNTHSTFAAVLDDPAVFTQTAMYKNTTDYCTAYQDGTPAEDTFYPNCSIPVNQYFWLNNIHPTYPMHDAMAMQISLKLQGYAPLQV
jgi:phospholipase/lecithinase/hemolysin